MTPTNAHKTDDASTGPIGVNAELFSQAADELHAVVSATATATNTILDCAETIVETVGEFRLALAEDKNSIVLMDAFLKDHQEITTRIFEACGFQDITSQRISKVFLQLKEIECRLDDLQEGREPAEPTASAVPEPSPHLTLLNGPQLPDDAVSQDDVDALFSNTDGE